ncbi:hypothetical protein CTI12_AA574310 [Artemisia annua]|uniref:Alpha-1,3-glucosyltransferase n=1 Tax=Artemisia annua TaxID=35608 RepID=A0A2U1KR08_ARTAN|nr:hypothetical protein CTI12_AA574310 [Artemisia annua]
MKPPKQKEAQRMKEKHTQRQSPNRSVIKDLLWFSGIATFLKVLLIPAYHSTDFEVHRNWLAITHTLPLSHWYTDETSPWTLDYPPFFAYFERFLSIFASFVDPTITDLYNGLNYKAPSVIVFQRLSVIASDTVLLYSVYKLTKNMELKKRFLIWVLVVWSPGLLIVDHLHFQYNGFLLGILLISLGALQKGNDLMGGFVFAVLLCFKHLFAVAGPVYFVYLFRHYCRGGFLRGFAKLVTMGVVVVGVFIAAYGPFAYHGQMLQVLRRMFPFGRGLCHAYWAPNFWVFYILSDKLLAFVLRKLGFHIQPPSASFTGGLVGDSSPFAILPTITPSVTFAMVLLAISPCLVKAWRNPQPKMIIRWVTYAYTCGFLFGWHVHEKASLHFLIPLAVVAVESIEDALSIYSLFPLLYEAQEYPIKVVLLLLHVALMWFGFSSKFSETSESDKKTGSISKNGGLVTGWIEKIYLVGFVVVEVWGQFLHPLILGDRLPFLPLMLISFYSSNGEDVKDEAETQARGESTMPERFRYLTKEAPDPPVRWPYFIALGFLIYAWRTVLWELHNWKRAAASVLQFVGYIGKLVLALIYHFLGDPITSTIRGIETTLYAIRAFYSQIVAYTPIPELSTIILLTSAILAISEVASPNSVDDQWHLLTVSGLTGYFAVKGMIGDLVFWTLLFGLFSFSRFVKKRDYVSSALPVAAVLVGVGEPWVRVVMMVCFAALAVVQYSKTQPEEVRGEVLTTTTEGRRVPIPLLCAALAIGVRVAAKWAGYRHLTWMVEVLLGEAESLPYQFNVKDLLAQIFFPSYLSGSSIWVKWLGPNIMVAFTMREGF